MRYPLAGIFNSIFLIICLVLPLAASAAVIQQEGSSLFAPDNGPVYQWRDDQAKPKAIVLAAHGATLHGGAYNGLGHLLAPLGYLVIAPDMQGFGHFYYQSTAPEGQRVVYDRCEADFTNLLKAIKSRYPGLPIIYAGESTGAQIGVRLAADHPDLINGMILSSTAPYIHLPPVHLLVVDLARCLFHPKRQVDLSPYIQRLISEDPKIAQERVNDPLSRNRLSLAQLLKFCWMSRRTLDYAPGIPASMPVLALQGTADHLFKPHSLTILMERVPSQDKTITWLKDHGHILLETEYIKLDTAESVVTWLDKHTQPRCVAADSDRLSTDLTSRQTIK